MDYEKMYKEALERAKNIYKDAIDMGENIRAKQCEIIFPELREELEEDKIRKTLICLIQEYYEKLSAFYKEVSVKDMLVWLEKQGESKFEQSIQDGDKIVNNEDGTYFNISQLERVAKKEFSWSEEDETALSDALWAMKQAAKIAKDENDMGNIWYAENWLKSIKERIKGE